MRITTTAESAHAAITARIAQATIDIAAGEQRAIELMPEAERSENAKRAVAAIRAGVDRAKKIRESLALMERSLRGVDTEAAIELNENECALFGAFALPPQ